VKKITGTMAKKMTGQTMSGEKKRDGEKKRSGN